MTSDPVNLTDLLTQRAKERAAGAKADPGQSAIPASISPAPPLQSDPAPKSDPGQSARAGLQPEKGYGRWLHTFWDDVAPTLKPIDVVVWGHLYRLTAGHKRTECLISMRGLAKRAAVSRNTVRDAVGRLERRGLVVRVSEDTRAASNDERGIVFRLPIAEQTPLGNRPGSKSDPGGNHAPMKETLKRDHESAPSKFDLRAIAARHLEIDRRLTRDDLAAKLRDHYRGQGIAPDEAVIAAALEGMAV
jgi:DNA-binding Lrp family transcriptional regulator